MNFHRQIVGRGLASLSAWFVLAAALSQCFCALAQEGHHERTYPYLKPHVEQTLRALGAYSSGQLPILEGFVVQGDDPLDHYQRPYYQYSIELLATPSGRTLVRVTAKITAWYLGHDSSNSGYRELTSNGRLENDLFARLDDELKSPAPRFAAEPKSGVAIDRPLPKTSAPLPDLRNTAPPIKPEATRPAAETPARPAVAPTVASTDADLDTLRKQTEALEKRRNNLSTTVHDLEDMLQNQAHPTDLVVTRKSGTPVRAQPESTARVLFRAEAEDEFEVLDLEKDWIHVQISGASRGWIRRSQVDFPAEPNRAPATAANSETNRSIPEPFHVTREEMVTFAGNWQPLKGKTVKVIWLQSASQDQTRTGPSAKLLCAKTLLLKAAGELAQSPTSVAGVVIVFDSADGGQVAAPISILERWKSGNLSDSEFWKQVSLDPVEAFQIPHKS